MFRDEMKIAVRFTLLSAVTLGILYPLVVTGFARVVFPSQSEGELIFRDGKVVGSRLIGQSFTSDVYFHGRPSAAGNGYDATASGGSNLGSSSQKLVARIDGDVAKYAGENTGPIPIDLVTASGSGLDPEISPAAAMFQIARVARARHLSVDRLRELVSAHVQGRQFGVLGDERVNVLQLNMDLDQLQK